MPRSTGRGKKEVVDSAADLEDQPERKDQYLKRIAKEDKANKKTFKKGDEYLVIEGKKVLVKFSNSVGSQYTRYWFNGKRHEDELKKVRAQGYGDVPFGDKTIRVPLKIDNGKLVKGA